MSTVLLECPVAGWVSDLTGLADAVFAEKMLGDGVAIDPTEGLLRAPCDGAIVSLAPTRHAVTLRTLEGAEILMHIGLDTVALAGAGFQAHVAEGERVRAGDALITFDLAFLASRARSLITPVIITNAADFRIVRRDCDRLVQAGDILMEIVRVDRVADAGAIESATKDHPGAEARTDVVVPLAHGVHARPAARIAKVLQPFAAEVTLVAGARRANARSSIAVMAMAIGYGETLTVAGRGADAQDAVRSVATLIAAGMGEPATAAVASPRAVVAPAEVSAPRDATPVEGVIRGVMAAPGMAVGQAYRLMAAQVEVRATSAGPAVEAPLLSAARDRVRCRLQATAVASVGARRAIVEAHQAFLDDPELVDAAQAAMKRGQSAGVAWRDAVEGYAQAMRGLADPRLAEREADLIDLKDQVLRALAGGDGADGGISSVAPPGAILLADDLLPSQLMAIDPGALTGFCTAKGGPTSHVAILAAAMGAPALVAAGPSVLAIPDGATLILDADGGSLHVDPTAERSSAARATLAVRAARRAAAAASAHAPAVMRCGTRIEVFANIGSQADAARAVAEGAEGVGLLRTEFLFLDRRTPPDEDEQLREYQAIADVLGDRPLIVRTLDVGGDKAAPYLPIPPEENPALGLRGVRVSLWRPELFKTQLRAILRVRGPGLRRIMIPMIASLDELQVVRALLDEARAEQGMEVPIELGIMVETPAAAVTAELLAREADFLSIGTNDLTQYVLALDRGHPELAARIDALHPAVLRMIAQTCSGAAAHGRWTGVCGGLASDALGAPILIGLGVSELSVTPNRVPEIKALVRSLSLEACRVHAAAALQQVSPQAVRALAQAFQAEV